jgi:glycosyltransferase involved in cell wall biosynthesis
LQVSVLIPAFRPTYLRQAIASVLTQSENKFELVISDDSDGDAILPVVEQFRDSRIRYVRTEGHVGSGENCRRLWSEANGDRLLFLMDDDLLMPHALVELGRRLEAHPRAAFAFGQRYVINEAGALIDRPTPWPKEFTIAEHAAISSALVGQVRNPIGEMNNVLLNRSIGLTVEDFLTYAGIPIRVNGDVSCFLNASRKGPAVGVGLPVAAFRKHGAQNSSPQFNPLFALGICEWELFLRGEYADGFLPVGDARQAAEKLSAAYRAWSQRLPVIAAMIPSLERFKGSLAAGRRDGLDEEFLTLWHGFQAEVEAAADRRAGHPEARG